MTSPPPPNGTRAPWKRLAVVALIGLAIGAAIWTSPLRFLLEPAHAAQWLRSVGGSWWAPLAFLGLYVLFSLGFLPVLPLAVAATLMWGWVVGGAVELIVATLAALPPYILARSSASRWVEAKLEERFGVNAERIRIRATSTLFLLRLIPVLPFSALNYLAGLAAIRPMPYLVATFTGMVPSVFVFTYLVDSFSAGALNLRQASLRAIAAGGILGLMYLLARLWLARQHASRKP